jgi:DNA-binding SARP family transcriptional activator
MAGARRAGKEELELRLLGPLEVVVGEREVAVGGMKPRALLAALALEPGRVVSSDRLIESLWPGDPPETAGHAVQVYVSQLRKALGAAQIARQGPGYALSVEPDHIDVHRFVELAGEGREQLAAGDPAAAATVLRDALALWRGSALADFTYEPFAQTEIARLEELRLVAVEERIEADLALGRHTELVSELEALVDSQPLRERPRAQLMLALYRSGRQADALAAYRSARETLVDDLGIDPGPELKGLEAAILRQDESLLLAEAEEARPAMQFRRLVTVLFVDLVDSMALAEALDAEALGEVLQLYLETVSAALTRHGGTVEKYAGDSVMAAFGVPISHEDDALRAARASLDIRAGVAALNDLLVQQHGLVLEIRIGIEAGEVVATPTDARQRLVAGEAVGIAAKLEQAAGPNEVVVGAVAGRLIDHVAELDPLGELELEGRREPVRAYRLLELTPVTAAFHARSEASLVGRKRELARLRTALEQATKTGEARTAVVVGAPGVGKSRLIAELTTRARGVSTLWGRCLSYGDGITYWPLREILDQARPGDERDAVLAALEAEPPPPAPEIALLFRRFCEAVARDRPLVVVFDDLHWAEPTLLDLVEHIASRGAGSILVVCGARDELLEHQARLFAGNDNLQWIDLQVLSSEDTDALLDGLGGSILESDQRARIVEAAEGNPFFLEQLLALAFEGGLARDVLPATVQALLAARLDRLGPGERALLERAAVIGKEFRLDDVVALLEPEAVPTAATHAEALVARGFVRPGVEGELRFRHVLVQEAVYRASPKRLRAQLHERFTGRFEERHPEVADIDEFAGYHLEQAYRLRVELGESDELTERLAEEAGRRLAAAGIRAFKRSDTHAARSLLRRATALLASDDPLSRELRCNLAIIEYGSGDPDTAVTLLEDVISEAAVAADEGTEAWARVELEYIGVRREHHTADALLAAADAAVPVLEREGDFRAVGRALLFAGWVHGGHRADHASWLESAERAREYYSLAGRPGATPLGEIACAIYWGPTPVTEGIRRLEHLLGQERSDLVGSAYLRAFLGGLVAQQGDVERGRALVLAAHDALLELGHPAAALAYGATVLGEIDLLEGDGEAAERTLRRLCRELERRHDLSQLASRASDLAEALVLQEKIDEAYEWTLVAEQHAAPDDVNARMMWPPVRARILARRGELAAATKLAQEGVSFTDTSDDLNRRAEAYRDFGEVQQLAGRPADAAETFSRAIELFESKGNVVGAARVRSLQDDLALV